MGGQVACEQTEFATDQALREYFETAGQGHVFRFWDALDGSERERLAGQARQIDLSAVLQGFEATQHARRSAPKLVPVDVEAALEHGGLAERWNDARARGAELLASGRVAVMVVAGGQATRLGFSGPKGTFPLGPVTGRTLFEQQAQKIRRLRVRAGGGIPWYVMTSPATDSATRAHFEASDYFGLPRSDVFFLCQSMMPSLDFDAKLMLLAPDRISQNPDGHGGSLTALLASGALDDMARRGVDTIFYYQVDNPLTRIGDEAFLGFHALTRAEMSCKVFRKRSPEEKVGVVARIDDRIGVVEYTEIDEEQQNARDASGELVFWAGNMAVHAFDTAFVRRVAEQSNALLPFHASAKKIPAIDVQGHPVEVTEPNGYKLERFVFDALAATERVCVVEAICEEEYSPVKNAQGDHSPETARRDLVARYRTWLETADIAPPSPGSMFEIDQSLIDGSEDARALGIQRFEQAGNAIRTETGDEA